MRDSGSGLLAEFLDRAFDRCTRGDAARSRGGSELGLSIAKAIAEAHDDTAHAANIGGEGADIWMSLPVSKGKSASPSA